MNPSPPAWLRWAPALFVFLWSTGFIGSRLGAPFAEHQVQDLQVGDHRGRRLPQPASGPDDPVGHRLHPPDEGDGQAGQRRRERVCRLPAQRDAIHPVQQLQHWRRGVRWRWGWGAGTTTTTPETIQNGTLVIDLYDPAISQLVWQSTATKQLNPSSNPQKNQANLLKAVTKMFKDYPPGAAK